MTQATEQRLSRAEWIRSMRSRVEAHAMRVRRSHTRTILISLVASTFATGLAGFAAAAGAAPVGTWRMTCGAVAVFTLVATIASGLQQQLDIPSQVASSSSCVGKLRALEFAIQVGNRSIEEIDAEIEELVRQYPELVG